MGVIIDDNYREKVRNIIRRNMETGRIKGMFSMLAGWRKPISKEHHRVVMWLIAMETTNPKYAAWRAAEIRRQQAIMKKMPRPKKYMN